MAIHHYEGRGTEAEGKRRGLNFLNCRVTADVTSSPRPWCISSDLVKAGGHAVKTRRPQKAARADGWLSGTGRCPELHASWKSLVRPAPDLPPNRLRTQDLIFRNLHQRTPVQRDLPNHLRPTFLREVPICNRPAESLAQGKR